MDQQDVIQAAQQIFQEYGASVEVHARRRIADTISRRDVQATGVWRRILRALFELQRERRAGH